MPTVKATSFADPMDVKVFQRCKALGHSDEFCFRTGDNGIGKWGHRTAQDHTPMCALPRDVWQAAGKTGGAKVKVAYRDRVVECILGDTMPHTRNIKNGAGIDMNPALCKALGVRIPADVRVTWSWA